MTSDSENGIFYANMNFPKDYPVNPPTMQFVTDIWHPNGMFSLRMCMFDGPPLLTSYLSQQSTLMAESVYPFYIHQEMTL